ncbi:hypothetical protein ZIOFF_038420 [Zingiber officinale]|uniref:Transcription repressor n=1 Tax=Zingiber officinale TaxID=94328 RepID=A0A8J5KSL1_ZINOF|nr:hypothetical protein ZIOFF_038420 [Zingiber officinale]
MVQARLEQMISHHWDPGVRHQRRMNSAVAETSKSRCTLLIAMDRRSHDPKGDFKVSMIEVITSKRMEEPKELRSLLNCYLSMNSSEQRLVILEAFHEVCSSLFCCRDNIIFNKGNAKPFMLNRNMKQQENNEDQDTKQKFMDLS